MEATGLGVCGWDARLTDFSEDGEEALVTRLADVVTRAEGLDPARLSAQDKVTRAVVLQQAESWQDRIAAPQVEYGITDTFAAPVGELFSLLPLVSIGEQEHADDYLTRLAGLPGVLATITQRHRTGVVNGRLPVRRLVRAACGQLDRYLANPDDDPLRRGSMAGRRCAPGLDQVSRCVAGARPTAWQAQRPGRFVLAARRRRDLRPAGASPHNHRPLP